MKTQPFLVGVLLVVSCTTVSQAQSLALLDDFQDNVVSSAWNLPDYEYGGTSSFAEVNGRLEFSNDATNAIVRRQWTGLASYDRNWTVSVEATVNQWTGTIEENQRAFASLVVYHALGGTVRGQTLEVELGLQPTVDAGNPWPDRFIGGTITTTSGQAGVSGWGISNFQGNPPIPITVSLLVSFDAVAKEISIGYDFDGDGGAAATYFTPISLVSGSNGYGTPLIVAWGMNEGDVFGLELMAGSRGMDVGQGFIAFDNLRSDSFAISAIPEPSTYAALAGFSALALVALRRRPGRREEPVLRMSVER